MKRVRQIISLIMAGLLLLTSMIACGRRAQYREESTDTVTNAQTMHPGESEQNTSLESNLETIPANPHKPPSPVGTGNPYAGISAEELLGLYHQTSKRTMISSDWGVNTPYYYIICRGTYGTGGKAYSKLTGKIITLCKEFGCRHDDNCVFSGDVEECVIIGDRIYLGIQNGFADRYRLYSFNLMLDDAKLIYEWSDQDAPWGFGVYGENIYMAGKIFSSDDTVKASMFVLDPVQKIYSNALGEDFIFQTGRMMENCFFYTTADGALWQYSLTNSTHTCLLDASLLDREEGDVRFHALELAGETKLRVIRQGVLQNEYFSYDLNTGEIETDESSLGENKVYLAWNSLGQYSLIMHNTTAYENDPHYTYYHDKVENWLVNYSGGEIWFRPDSNSELSLLVNMQTDGIPDAIRGIVATDGKTLVVYYNTYKDFANIYNEYNKETPGDSIMRYAIIDMETGIIYKVN